MEAADEIQAVDLLTLVKEDCHALCVRVHFSRRGPQTQEQVSRVQLWQALTSAAGCERRGRKYMPKEMGSV